MFYCGSNIPKNKRWLSSASEEYCQVHIFFTLNSEHLVLKKTSLSKHLLRRIECIGIWRLNTMLGKNTFNQALKRNVTVFKWTLSLVKCLEVHLTSTKSILGRNDPFLYVMSRSCRTMSWPRTYHDVVTGLQLTLTGIPSSWKVIFRLDFHIIPLFPILLFFRDWIFAYFYFYHFLLKVVAFFKYGWMF